ncbi:MAG: T9SS type A sorting domain-containing protein, partial [Bacteroidales bacterium]|nr:T9SS type A sorting domain-containing protein [Bacteroidales bacterium]
PDNSNWITEVCKNSGYLFTAEPINEQYYLHWETSCAEPDEFDGPEYNVHFNNLICDIHLMHVDKITGCISEAFVHGIEEFQPDEIQWDEYQVCANEIMNLSIPYENNVLYEWRVMQENMASITTGHYSNDINIQANALDGVFSLILKRSFCDEHIEDTVQIEIIPYLIPAFYKIENICQYDTVELAPNYDGDLIGTWVWTIEGNTFPIFGTAEDAIIYYAFNNAGIIPISLSFTAETCTQAYESIISVLVNPAPDVSCSYTSISTTAIELNASVQAQDIGIYSYAWSVPAVGPVVVVNNPNETSYIVTVTNTLTECKTIKEIVLPSQGGGCMINQGSITYTQNCDSAVFNRLGHSETEMINWSFRQNSSSPSYTTSGNYNETCSVKFENAGYYKIIASETYDDCLYYAELNIEVPLVPRIHIKRTCLGTNQINLQLINLSDYMTGVNIDNIIWKINGIPSTGITAVNSGTHIIELTVYYTYNSVQYQCTTSETVTYQRGVANFNISPGPYCAGTPVQFTDNSTNAISWVYEFDENSDHQNRNPHNIQNFGNSDAGGISITLSIQDNIGCLSKYSTNITVNPNELVGVLKPVDGPFCAGEEWPAEYDFEATNITEPYNIAWFPLGQTANDTTTTNTNSLLQTGSYYVLLSNTNNCMFQSDYKNICFENTPHAEISGNDTYCPDETIRLFGQTGNYTYLWEGLGNLSFNTPNINLSASDLTSGNYSLTLTVSNNECSSSDTMNILINPKPLAPLIDFGANQCLHIPPVDLISLSNQPLYWSTGTYGTHTTTFNPGYHLAHYVDAVTGCKSEYAKINVIKPPDFNELMSGCFKFCPEDLPRWILPPMGYFESWAWYLNSYNIQYGTYESPYNQNILLNIPDYGSYFMKLYYPTNCSTNSRYLEIHEKEYCDTCEISMRILTPNCDVGKCELILIFNYYIMNTSLTSTATLVEVNNPTINWLHPSLPINIPATSVINFNFYVTLENLDQQIIQLEFVFYQNNILCTHIVETDLSQVLANCITEECRGEITSIDFIDNISSTGMSYFDFRIDFEMGMNNVQVYSDQVNVIDYEYYPSSGEIRGLFSITPLQLLELIDNEGDICFRIYACTNERICEAEICFPASQLGVQQRASSFKIIEQKEKPEKTVSSSQFGLYPNPTNNTLYITGNETEFLQAIIIDMQARKLKISDSPEINVSKLNPGTYIVRVINKSEQIQYLKFIKK